MIGRALARTLVAVAEELDGLDADWAIGGATALAVHGYERATRDVDLLVGDDSRVALLAGLDARGLRVEEAFAPSHYVVAVRGTRDPDVRIDLLFPALGAECLGLLAARRVTLAGREMPVMPLAYLAAAKLAVDPREDPDRYAKDQHDLRALWSRGLLDVLEDSAELSSVLLRTNIDKLTILPSGTAHARATELLASDAMRNLLNDIATRYSDRIVIFDSPPLLLTTEARVLASHMGQVVIVVQAGKTLQSDVQSALAAIDSCPIRLMLLNQAQTSSHGGYGYGYGGYGYGYGRNPEAEKQPA